MVGLSADQLVGEDGDCHERGEQPYCPGQKKYAMEKSVFWCALVYCKVFTRSFSVACVLGRLLCTWDVDKVN